MPIPDYQTLMRPLLELLADGEEHALRDLRGVLADTFALTQEEREQMLPSGGSRLFTDRVPCAADCVVARTQAPTVWTFAAFR
jgi:restriction system protein